MNKPMTLDDSLVMIARLDLRDDARTLEEWDWIAEAKAEREAENAWLRHAENANWAEIAYLEQYAPWAI